MSGNVFEWTSDWYGEYPATETDPVGPSFGSFRVLRGGGWAGSAFDARAAYRGASESVTSWPRIILSTLLAVALIAVGVYWGIRPAAPGRQTQFAVNRIRCVDDALKKLRAVCIIPNAAFHRGLLVAGAPAERPVPLSDTLPIAEGIVHRARIQPARSALPRQKKSRLRKWALRLSRGDSRKLLLGVGEVFSAKVNLP
jgi:hypothetical protein